MATPSDDEGAAGDRLREALDETWDALERIADTIERPAPAPCPEGRG